MDNYDECQENGKLFCTAEVLLFPLSDKRSDIKVWNFIKELKNNKHSFHHDELYHGICLNDTKSTDYGLLSDQEIQKRISRIYMNKYAHLNLGTKIRQVYCLNKNDQIYKIGFYDISVLFVTVGYLIYVLYATYFDYESRKKKICLTDYKRKWILTFSLLNNWDILNKQNKNPEFDRLKCMQGFRFYTNAMIVFYHTLFSYTTAFVENTDYLEEIDNNALRLLFRNSLMFLVQIFFLFSSFLLSYNTFKLMAENPKFQLKSMVLLLVNRYFRLIAVVLVLLLLEISVWSVRMLSGPLTFYMHQEYLRCQKNWWTNVLFVSNMHSCQDMCYVIMWYLSADTQLYIISLLILSIIWINQKKNAKWILTFSILVAILIQCFIVYKNNLPANYLLTPENIKLSKIQCDMFEKLYSSTVANMATYMVGLGFGYFYFTYKNHNLLQNKILGIIWKPLFLILPSLAIFLTMYNSRSSPLVSAILGGILKPLFATGMAIGVFGLTQKPGGILPKIFENKWVLFLGSFTYSTYLSHFGPIFARTTLAKSPYYISDFILLRSFLLDYTKAVPIGLLMHLMVELPAIQLQNVYIPKVKKKTI